MADFVELFQNAQIRFVSRTLNLICFDIIVKGDVYALHCQCLVRVFDGRKPIVSSEDVYLPGSNYDGDEDSWNWSNDVGKALFDDQIKAVSDYQMTIREFSVKDCGDIIIECVNGMRIEVIITTLSSEEPWNESWRLFRLHDYNNFTIVCYGTQIVRE